MLSASPSHVEREGSEGSERDLVHRGAENWMSSRRHRGQDGSFITALLLHADRKRERQIKVTELRPTPHMQIFSTL